MAESKVSALESTPTSTWSSELEAIFKQLQFACVPFTVPRANGYQIVQLVGGVAS